MNNTRTMVQESKVLNTPGAEKRSKKELFEALRRELETPVLDKASKAVWDLILEKDGLGKEIDDTVEAVFWQLNGKDPPVSSSLSGHVAAEEDRSTSGKKRTFETMNANGSNDAINHTSTSTSKLPQQTDGTLPRNKQSSSYSTPQSVTLTSNTGTAASHVSVLCSGHHDSTPLPSGEPKIIAQGAAPVNSMIPCTGAIHTTPLPSRPVHMTTPSYGYPYMVNTAAGAANIPNSAIASGIQGNLASAQGHMLHASSSATSAPLCSSALGHSHMSHPVPGPLHVVNEGSGLVQPNPSILPTSGQLMGPMVAHASVHGPLVNSVPGNTIMNGSVTGIPNPRMSTGPACFRQ
eukprot:TRINITY_DN1166_c0_g1_i1.p1 TRINITY_DN1166_c0_g1~~TRINITY_DN1166_c0_g1_i1.p1  ORF type:complete len:349 (-),score=45.49 TRINITY_DN1166_c0_g1_i1:380-1426(-)